MILSFRKFTIILLPSWTIFINSLTLILIIFPFSPITLKHRSILTLSRLLTKFQITFIFGSMRIVYLSMSNQFVILESAIDNSAVFHLQRPFSTFFTILVLTFIDEKCIIIMISTRSMSQFSSWMKRTLKILNRITNYICLMTSFGF